MKQLLELEDMKRRLADAQTATSEAEIRKVDAENHKVEAENRKVEAETTHETLLVIKKVHTRTTQKLLSELEN